jgi:hypothetical protein
MIDRASPHFPQILNNFEFFRPISLTFSVLIMLYFIIIYYSISIPTIQFRFRQNKFEAYLTSRGTFNLYDPSFIRRINHDFDLTACSRCNLTQKSREVSQHNIIISFAKGSNTAEGYTSFVRSVRATGCVAKILFLCTRTFFFSFSKGERELMYDCGTIFMNAGPSGVSGFKFYTYRYALYAYFFELYQIYFDKVVMTDVKDTLVQTDPFENFPSKGFWCTVENNIFQYNLYNVLRINQSEASSTLSRRWTFWNKKMINGGLCFGKMEYVYEFLVYFINFDYLKRFPSLNDQGFLNIMYYRNNFKMRADFRGRYMMSAAFHAFRPNRTSSGLWVTEYDTIPSVIHQYDRICYIKTKIDTVCPQDPRQRGNFALHRRYMLQLCNGTRFMRDAEVPEMYKAPPYVTSFA